MLLSSLGGDNTDQKYKVGYLVIKESFRGWIYEYCYSYVALMNRVKELVNAPHVKKISINCCEAETLKEV